MNTHEHLKTPPLTEKTEKQKRNALLACLICLFIGLSGQLPSKFALLGLTFEESDQSLLGWFVLFISIALFINFMLSTIVDVTEWVKPILFDNMKFKAQQARTGTSERFEAWEARSHEIDNPKNISELNFQEVNYEVELELNKKIRYQYYTIYLKLIFEIALPLFTCAVGIYFMTLKQISL